MPTPEPHDPPLSRRTMGDQLHPSLADNTTTATLPQPTTRRQWWKETDQAELNWNSALVAAGGSNHRQHDYESCRCSSRPETRWIGSTMTSFLSLRQTCCRVAPDPPYPPRPWAQGEGPWAGPFGPKSTPPAIGCRPRTARGRAPETCRWVSFTLYCSPRHRVLKNCSTLAGASRASPACEGGCCTSSAGRVGHGPPTSTRQRAHWRARPMVEVAGLPRQELRPVGVRKETVTSTGVGRNSRRSVIR